MVGLYFKRLFNSRTFFNRIILLLKFRTLFQKTFSKNFFGGYQSLFVWPTITQEPIDPLTDLPQI